MTPAEQRAAFMKAIEEDPYDRETRLVLADWLEECGNLPGDDDLAKEQREWTAEKYDAGLWMDQFANQLNDKYDIGLDRDDLIRIGNRYLDKGVEYELPGYLTERIEEATGKFWDNFAILTGRTVSDTTSPFADGEAYTPCAC